MIDRYKGRPVHAFAGTALLLFLLSGCGAAAGPGTNAEEPSSAAPPAASSAAPDSTSSSRSSGIQKAQTIPPDVVPAMDGSQPVSFTIPALDRQSKIIETGLRKDNTLEVPPAYEGAPASWYIGSPTPGEIGPSVLLGHVNSTEDESGVFYNLEALEEGDEVSITREDGSTATFEVYKSEVYPKNNFPTKAVYQPTDGAELRLITCDGFTETTGEFVDNLVVYAKLVAAT